MVIKRSGPAEPFDRGKVIDGLRAATKNRPGHRGPARDDGPRGGGRDAGRGRRRPHPNRWDWPCSSGCGLVDEVAYLRFASVYKGFEGAEDFRREVGLLTKTTAPKRPEG